MTCPRIEIAGLRMDSVIGDVDLVGEDSEPHLAVRLQALYAKIASSRAVAGAVLSLSVTL